jgi:hypothetical protein
MRRSIRLSVLCLAAGATMSACKPDTVINTPVVPTAGVRFINALPDSAGAFGLDFRFVDIVESNAQFRVPFRNSPTTTAGVTASALTQFKGAQAGSRHFIIFLDDTIQAIASTKLKDSTLTLDAGKNYTVILWGEARAGQMQLKVIEDTPADPGSKVALRVINAGSTAIDVRTFATGGTLPAAATWSNVAARSISSFVNADTGSINYNVQPAGGGTALFADMTALLGAAASSSAGAGAKLDIEPLPGTRVAGSAVTLVVFPRSTAGTRTPQTAAFAVPAGAFMWDRRPPRGF